MRRAKRQSKPKTKCSCGVRTIPADNDFLWDLQDGMTHWRGHPCVAGAPEMKSPGPAVSRRR